MFARQIRYGSCPEKLTEERMYGLGTDLEKASLREQQAKVRAEAGLRTVSENQKVEWLNMKNGAAIGRKGWLENV